MPPFHTQLSSGDSKSIIRDGIEPGGGGGLEFDLREVVAALGVRVAASQWYARDLEYISKDEQDLPIMETMASGHAVSGADLISETERLLQVIDGEFIATELDGETPWVIVRAVDSSSWEVVSNDLAVCEAVRKRFRMVEEHDFDAANR